MPMTERNRAFALQELRATPRSTVEVEARVAVDGHLTACMLRDVSQGGTFARMGWVPHGTIVRVWFRLPDEVLEIEAVARWSNDEGVGLQFGSMRARDAYALGQYLASLKK